VAVANCASGDATTYALFRKPTRSSSFVGAKVTKKDARLHSARSAGKFSPPTASPRPHGQPSDVDMASLTADAEKLTAHIEVSGLLRCTEISGGEFVSTSRDIRR